MRRGEPVSSAFCLTVVPGIFCQSQTPKMSRYSSPDCMSTKQPSARWWLNSPSLLPARPCWPAVSNAYGRRHSTSTGDGSSGRHARNGGCRPAAVQSPRPAAPSRQRLELLFPPGLQIEHPLGHGNEVTRRLTFPRDLTPLGPKVRPHSPASSTGFRRESGARALDLFLWKRQSRSVEQHGRLGTIRQERRPVTVAVKARAVLVETVIRLDSLAQPHADLFHNPTVGLRHQFRITLQQRPAP